jgi:hypothetical protein
MELNLFYTFLLLSVLGFFYRRFTDKFDYLTMKKDNAFLKTYLETHYGGEFNTKKPIAWIYLPFETNSMKWDSFYSRNNTDINNTLVRELINKNTKTLRTHFNVLLIDDSSFKYLLDDTVADLKTIGSPLKDKLVDLYFIKLIKNYGGVRIPNHFAIQNPIKLYDMLHLTDKEHIVCFKKPFNHTLVYDTQFIGSLFNNNKTIERLEHLQTVLISNDSVDESNFKDTSIPHLVSDNIIQYDVSLSGIYDSDENILHVEDFMSETKPIKMKDNTFMVFLPIENLSKRTHYNWITYVSSSHSNQISKFLY